MENNYLPEAITETRKFIVTLSGDEYTLNLILYTDGSILISMESLLCHYSNDFSAKNIKEITSLSKFELTAQNVFQIMCNCFDTAHQYDIEFIFSDNDAIDIKILTPPFINERLQYTFTIDKVELSDKKIMANILKKIMKEKISFDNHIADMDDKIIRLENKIIQQETEIKNMKEKCGNLETEIIQQETEIKYMNKKCNKLEIGIKNTDDKCGKLETEIKNMKEKCSKLETGIKNTNDKCSKLETGIKNTNDKCSKLETGIKNTNDKCSKLETGIKNTNDKCSKLETGIKNTNDKCSKLETEIKNTNDKCSKLVTV
jgi:predicted  nucleic acid-binding Zn-ribbon protein